MLKYLIQEESKNKIIAVISVLVPNSKIYLFGSRARGTNSEWSDIDLVLDRGSKIDRSIISELNDVIAALSIPYKVDILDLYSVSDAMKKEIERDKILWKA